jgi:transposase
MKRNAHTGAETMKRSRRNHTAAFKAKVALAAIKGEKTLVELSTQFDVHTNQIAQWKAQLLEGALGVFLTPAERRETVGPSVKDMQAKIGQLALENDFLAVALGRIDGASAKK